MMGLIWTTLLWLQMVLLSWRSPWPQLTCGVCERSPSVPVQGLLLKGWGGRYLGQSWQQDRSGSTHQTLGANSAAGAVSLWITTAITKMIVYLKYYLRTSTRGRYWVGRGALPQRSAVCLTAVFLILQTSIPGGGGTQPLAAPA